MPTLHIVATKSLPRPVLDKLNCMQLYIHLQRASSRMGQLCPAKLSAHVSNNYAVVPSPHAGGLLFCSQQLLETKEAPHCALLEPSLLALAGVCYRPDMKGIAAGFSASRAARACLQGSWLKESERSTVGVVKIRSSSREVRIRVLLFL